MTRNEEGNMVYNKKKVMLHTLFFVIGISFAFFVLGLGVSAVGQFFKSNQLLFARIGGVIIILFGLYQLGFFGISKLLIKEKRLPIHAEKFAMSPLVALAMGFTFSFAWTPCVGPVLASVLMMTASTASVQQGIPLIACYALGFCIPFLVMGVFTTSVLSFFQRYKNVVKYTVKVGGVLLIIMGIMVLAGKFNTTTGYSSTNNTNKNDTTEALDIDDKSEGEASDTGAEADKNSDTETEDVYPAIDFTLTDQFGQEHSLSDYKGKTIFLNFWATWCPPCRAEMPDIQKLYEYYTENPSENVVILGVATPNYRKEESIKGIQDFLEENGYTYPVLMDESAELFGAYGIMSYPTTFMIDKDGNVFGYVSGSMTEETMKSIIQQTIEGR